MFSARLLAFSIGFLLLGQATLWVRLFGVIHFSLLQGFAFVLAMYVIGGLLGARIGRRFCKSSLNLWEISGFVLLSASFFDLISPWFYEAFTLGQYQIRIGGMLMVLTAFLKAIIFPIANHWCMLAAGPQLVRWNSRGYVVSILGAVAGFLLTEIIFLNVFSMEHGFVFFAVGAFLVSSYCFRECLAPSLRVMTSLFAVVIFSFVLLQETAGFFPQGGGVDTGALVSSNELPGGNLALALQKPPPTVLMGAWLQLLASLPPDFDWREKKHGTHKVKNLASSSDRRWFPSAPELKWVSLMTSRHLLAEYRYSKKGGQRQYIEV